MSDQKNINIDTFVLPKPPKWDAYMHGWKNNLSNPKREESDEQTETTERE